MGALASSCLGNRTPAPPRCFWPVIRSRSADVPALCPTPQGPGPPEPGAGPPSAAEQRLWRQ